MRYAVVSSLGKDKTGMHMHRRHQAREDVTYAKFRTAPEEQRASQLNADSNLDTGSYQNLVGRDIIRVAKISIC